MEELRVLMSVELPRITLAFGERQSPWLLSPLLSSLQFAYPSMLWWMLAAALPWLLLWPPRVAPPQIRWAAMQFLTDVSPEMRRSQRRSRWTLLALRTAILLLIPFSLAQPFWSSSTAHPTETRGPTHWVYVLDASASLRTETVIGQRWDLVRNELARRWRNLPAADAISVFVVSREARPLFSQPTSDAQAVLEKLRSLEPTEGDIAWDALQPSLVQLLNTYQPDYAKQRVIVVSDMQASSWQAWKSPEEFTALTPSTRADLTWELLAVTPPAARENISWTELVAIEPSTVLGRPSRWQSALRNWDRVPRRVTAELKLDGRAVASQEVELAAQSTTTLRWETRPPRTGVILVEASLSDDCYALDNRISAPLFVDATLRTVVVANSLANPNPVAAAFTAPELAPYRSSAQLTLAHQLAAQVQQRPTCVVTDDVWGWNETSADALAEYVQLGGGWVAFLGPRAQSAAYEPLRMRWPALWPWSLTKPASRDSYRWAEPAAATASALRDLWQQTPRSGWSSVPIWEYWQLTPAQASSELTISDPTSAQPTSAQPTTSEPTVVCQYLNGDAAWLEHRWGQGGVLVCSTSPSLTIGEFAHETADLPWSAIGKWPGFVPLLHAAALQTAGHRWRPQVVSVGSSWPVSAKSTASTLGAANLALSRWQQWTQGATIPVDRSTGAMEHQGLFAQLSGSGEPSTWLSVRSTAGESAPELVEDSIYAQFDVVQHLGSRLEAAAGADAQSDRSSRPSRSGGDSSTADGPLVVAQPSGAEEGTWFGTTLGIIVVGGLLLLEFWLGTRAWTTAN